MFQLIVLWTLNACQVAPIQTATPAQPRFQQLAQIEPCVWPNRCKDYQAAAEPVQICLWPNKCKDQAPVLAQFKPCVLPNRCRGGEAQDDLQFN